MKQKKNSDMKFEKNMISFWQNKIAKFEKNHTKIITKIAAKNLIIFQPKT